MTQEYAVGVDLGTTSVKVYVMDIKSKEVIEKNQKNTCADIQSKPNQSMQSVQKIIEAVNDCFEEIPPELLYHVTKIGVCGQMHGVVLWNAEENSKPWKNGTKKEVIINENMVSCLYTWQDARCDQAFIESLPKSLSHLPVHPGFGCATLAWLKKHDPETLKKYQYAGTIQDFFTSLLCDSLQPIISYQNAASWGFFDCHKKNWDVKNLKLCEFPSEFLPKVFERPNGVIGCLVHNYFGINPGATVDVAYGDLQCSILSSIQTNDIFLNISTSAQLAFIPKNWHLLEATKSGSLEFFPFYNNQYVAVLAMMNGGNCIKSFVQMIHSWMGCMGVNIPEETVWKKLLELGENGNAATGLTVKPYLLKERYGAEEGASISNISINDLRLENIFRGICRGIAKNIHSQISDEFLEQLQGKRIVGTGSALVKNKILQDEIRNVFNVPLHVLPNAEAAHGAALSSLLQ